MINWLSLKPEFKKLEDKRPRRSKRSLRDIRSVKKRINLQHAQQQHQFEEHQRKLNEVLGHIRRHQKLVDIHFKHVKESVHTLSLCVDAQQDILRDIVTGSEIFPVSAHVGWSAQLNGSPPCKNLAL